MDAENAIEKIQIMKLEKSELANEVMKLRKMAKEKDALLQEKEKEIEILSAKTKPDFIIVSEKIQSDRCIRFSPPKEIKTKLKVGKKVRLEIKMVYVEK